MKQFRNHRNFRVRARAISCTEHAHMLCEGDWMRAPMSLSHTCSFVLAMQLLGQFQYGRRFFWAIHFCFQFGVLDAGHMTNHAFYVQYWPDRRPLIRSATMSRVARFHEQFSQTTISAVKKTKETKSKYKGKQKH